MRWTECEFGKMLAIGLLLALTTIDSVDGTDNRSRCPSNQFFIYPCGCRPIGETAIAIDCPDSNLAMISLGLSNVKMPIETLTIRDSNIERIFGSLFETEIVYNLIIMNTSVSSIDEKSLKPLSPALQTLQLIQTRFKSIPVNVISQLTNLTKLKIAENEAISDVANNAFQKLTALIELDLSRNSISKLASNSLNGLAALETLDLNGNRLTAIERSLFRVCKKLKYLDLSGNSFHAFGKSDFNDLSSLLYLNVSRNAIAELPRTVFTRSAQLRLLDLSYNNLTEIDSYLLRGVRFLRDFSARGNKISEVARRAFSASTRLRSIDLAENRLETLESESFKDMQWLDRLDLSANRISRIASGAFQRMFQVAINMSANNISTIEAKAFQELSNVTTLDLSFNRIERINSRAFDECDVTVFLLNDNLIANLSHAAVFANLTGLKVLNLTNNRIGELGRRDFTPKRFYELHTLDLSRNRIRDIGGNVFEKFASVRHIDLRYNNLTKIGFSAFGSIPTLLELDISHNNIVDIASGGVSSLVSVKTIHANDNKIRKMFAIPLALNVLHLERNQISSIRSNVFPMINSLLEIYLDHNNISKLEDQSFAHCLTLNTLSLSHNRIESVPHATLQHLTSLQYLYLDHNNITKLDRKAFGNLRIVFHLRLDHNQIANVSDYAFEGLLQLLNLNLSHNNISQLSPEAFASLVSLKTLDLSNNRLNQLDNRTHGIIDPLLSLESLNLSRNQISLIKEKSFPYSPWIPYKLKSLDLSGNFIPIITPYFDDGLQKVEWLSLRDNIVNDIQANIFGNMSYLRHLDLSGNQLRKLAKGLFAGNVANLTHLSVARNKLSSIYVPEIVNMKNLKLLNLTGNKLMNINSDLLKQIKTGLTLEFNDNHLYCDCHLLPLRAWIESDVHKSELNGVTSRVRDHWSSVVCKEPIGLLNKSLTALKPTQLNCKDDELEAYSSHFVEKSDLKVRAIDWSRRRRQNSVRIVWLVLNRVDDIASFRIVLTDEYRQQIVTNETLDYNHRDFTIAGLDEDSTYVVCIIAVESTGKERPQSASQCVPFDSRNTNVENTVSKLKLSKREYSPVRSQSSANIRVLSENLFITFLILNIFLYNKNLNA